MSESNLPETILRSPEEEQSAARQDLLDRFADQPNNDALWQTAYSWVRAEGDERARQGIASDIPVNELIAMADAVRQTPQAERYNLMAQRASNGKYWFDVIEGFSSDQVRKVQADVIKSWVNDENSPAHFSNALDIGTGVGKSLAILEGSADNVVGLDQNPTLLRIAKEKAGAHTSLVQGSTDELPFADSSFDLISSQGLRAALDRQATMDFLRELARVMTPSGIYIEGYYYPQEDGQPHPDLSRFTETSKAMLTDMIGDSVSGALDRSDHLSRDEEYAFLAELGLRMQHDVLLDEDGVSRTLINVISKENQEPYEDDSYSLEIVTVLEEFSEKYGFDNETLEEIKSLPFEEALEVAYGYLTQAELNADEILAQFFETEN